MRIKRFSYKNKATGWELAPMEFGDFNLLVGVSGVGKSQILRAILNVQKIAEGDFFENTEWKINFDLDNGTDCLWSGEFGQNPDEFVLPGVNVQDFVKEKFCLASDLLFKRDEHGAVFHNTASPFDLPTNESFIDTLRSHADIIPIRDSLSKIFNSETITIRRDLIVRHNLYEFLEILPSLETIQRSKLPTYFKLVLVYKLFPVIFEEIKDIFISVFPNVTDMQITGFDKNSAALPILSIEENQIMIPHKNMSTGMLKVLRYISEVYLLPPHSVILIDEFENSLGVNCIDILSELPYRQRGLQFIITSHHPYIINNFPMAYWKIVTRQGSVVTVKNATDFEELNPSKVDAFVQLMNLEEYKEGING